MESRAVMAALIVWRAEASQQESATFPQAASPLSPHLSPAVATQPFTFISPCHRTPVLKFIYALFVLTVLPGLFLPFLHAITSR